MSTITPALLRTPEGVPYVLWEGVATGDTVVGFPVRDRLGMNAAVQFRGSFGGATTKLQVSLDNTTYADMKDIHGVAVSATAAGVFDISTSAIYLRPSVTGGTEDAVDIILVLRGPASSV
jgi:hypothetical protein